MSSKCCVAAGNFAVCCQAGHWRQNCATGWCCIARHLHEAVCVCGFCTSAMCCIKGVINTFSGHMLVPSDADCTSRCVHTHQMQVHYMAAMHKFILCPSDAWFVTCISPLAWFLHDSAHPGCNERVQHVAGPGFLHVRCRHLRAQRVTNPLLMSQLAYLPKVKFVCLCFLPCR